MTVLKELIGTKNNANHPIKEAKADAPQNTCTEMNGLSDDMRLLSMHSDDAEFHVSEYKTEMCASDDQQFRLASKEKYSIASIGLAIPVLTSQSEKNLL